jgi:hypothetical protein
MSGVRYCIPELVILDRAAARHARREVKRVACPAVASVAELQCPQSLYGNRMTQLVLERAGGEPVEASNALIVPSPKLPTGSALLNAPILAGAIASPQGEFSGPAKISRYSSVPLKS